MNRRVQHWVDGSPTSALPCDDRGVLYGDGLFETIAVVDGKLRAWPLHLARVQRGCRALAIVPPLGAEFDADLATLEPELVTRTRAVLRLTVTRGSGRRGYAPDRTSAARRIWSLSSWPSAMTPPARRIGLTAVWLQTTLARQPRLAGIKHLNRLEQVLAARELAGSNAEEGLVCDADGFVIEAVSANVFVRRSDTLMTPELSQCGVAGVARERVLQAANALGYRAVVTRLRRADVAAADEVILTNALHGARAVAELGGVRWSAFPATRALDRVLNEETLLP